MPYIPQPINFNVGQGAAAAAPDPIIYESSCTPMNWTTEPSSGAKGTVVSNESSIYYGKSITDTQYYLKQNGTTSGTASAKIIQCSDGSTKHTFWTMNISDISATGAWTTETSTPYTGTITTGDIIGMEFTHAFGIGRYNGNCLDGTYSGYASTATDCSNDHDFDLWYKYTVV